MIISRVDLDAGRAGFAADPDIDLSAPRLEPVHPGEILRDEFMTPLGLSAYRLGNDIGVPVNRISEMVHGRRRITADTALRFEQVFGASAEFWMNLQTAYDLEVARTTNPRPASRPAYEARLYERPPETGHDAGFREPQATFREGSNGRKK